MAFVVTDEEWLNRLNEDARSKKDRKLNFSTGPFQSFEQFIRDTYGSERPFETAQGIPFAYKPGGNFMHRPLLDVPNINMGMSWFTMQNIFKPRFCQIMERDFFRCVSRVGLRNTDKFCKIYWEDLLECQNHDKAKKRTLVMQKVRKVKKVEPMRDVPYNALLDPNFR